MEQSTCMYVYTHPHACACLYTTLYEYHIYYNIRAGRCRVQSHVKLDPNNLVGGIIRPGLICTQPHSYCQKQSIFMHTYSYPDYPKDESLIVVNSHLSSTQRGKAMKSSVLHSVNFQCVNIFFGSGTYMSR